MKRPGCEVWTAEVAERRPVHDVLLDEVELARVDALRRPIDRARFVVGVAVLKCAVAAYAGCPAPSVRVDRRCETCGGQHGRPRLPGTDLHVSVSHSGPLVVVALTEAGPVGVDAEHRVTNRQLPAARDVVTASEPIVGPGDLLTYWCRKESVVKATGDGVRVPLREVVVSPASERARLVSFRGQPLAAFLTDLDLGAAYAAALAILSADDITVRVRSAAQLLEG
jgi:4'-phosphopantetheinyl transferase